MTNVKSTIKYVAMLCAVVAFSVACNNDDDNGSNPYNGLKAVEFENSPRGEISAAPTGATIIQNGQLLKQYNVTYEKSVEFNTADLIKNGDNQIIEKTLLYPGSVLRGSSFMNGIYDPLVLSNEFHPVTVYAAIRGRKDKTIYRETVEMKGSTIYQAMSDIIEAVTYGSDGQFDAQNYPAEYTYEADSVNTGESFMKTVNIHAKANFLGIVKADFGYDYSQSSTQSKKYILVKFKQYIYSIGINPQAQWFEGSLNSGECGSYEPVYISSVDYGKVAYLLIETNSRSNETSEAVKSSLSVAFAKVGGSVDYNTNTTLKTWFSQGKVRVSVLGGSSSVIVTDYKSFLDYIKPPATANTLIASAAPISYTVRRLKDNTEVQMVNYYTDVIKEWRP